MVDDAKDSILKFAKKVESAVVGKVDGKKGTGEAIKRVNGPEHVGMLKGK